MIALVVVGISLCREVRRDLFPIRVVSCFKIIRRFFLWNVLKFKGYNWSDCIVFAGDSGLAGRIPHGHGNIECIEVMALIHAIDGHIIMIFVRFIFVEIVKI